MSSVLVKGMKMPKKCIDCMGVRLNIAISMMGGICPYCKEIRTDYNMTTERPSDCPLVALPDTHGRLVDADYFKEHLIACAENGRPLHRMYTELDELIDAVDNVPTIVEAEDRE